MTEDTITLEVTPENAGNRIDKFISDNIDDLTRSAVQGLLEKGNILVNGGTVSKNYKLKNGDTVEVDIPETEEESEQYNFNDGQGIQLEMTVTILCRGQSQEKLVETMSAYTDFILDEIRKDCTLGNIGEGSAIGTRKFYLDAGTVENQLTASETTLTLLYIRKYE